MAQKDYDNLRFSQVAQLRYEQGSADLITVKKLFNDVSNTLNRETNYNIRRCLISIEDAINLSTAVSGQAGSQRIYPQFTEGRTETENNETYVCFLGIGDSSLVDTVSLELQGAIRGDDFLGIKDAEFICLLRVQEEKGYFGAISTMRRIRGKVQKVLRKNHVYGRSVPIGITRKEDDEMIEDPAFIQRAEDAMSAAKILGRNGILYVDFIGYDHYINGLLEGQLPIRSIPDSVHFEDGNGIHVIETTPEDLETTVDDLEELSENFFESIDS